jgi:DNA polymerase-1
MIIDALNMYFRAYIVDPSVSTNGQPIGGTKGFLKILQKLCRETTPDHVVIAWDGGSSRRRSLQKNYKEGRKPIRLNRGIHNLSENEEAKNKIWQQTRLAEYLNLMPVSQLYVDNLEADDIIAFVNNMRELSDWQKVIVSSDKDFIQLCGDNTVLYRPVQKEVLNSGRIIENYGIHPNNFTLARAICGDKSDNLAGVGSVGLKTVAKRFPFLSEEKSHTIMDLIIACKKEENKLKVHLNILEKADLVENNYKLMQLYAPSISPQSKQKIKNSILNLDTSFNKTGVHAMMLEDGFGVYDWSSLFQTLQRIIANQ